MNRGNAALAPLSHQLPESSTKLNGAAGGYFSGHGCRFTAHDMLAGTYRGGVIVVAGPQAREGVATRDHTVWHGVCTDMAAMGNTR